MDKYFIVTARPHIFNEIIQNMGIQGNQAVMVSDWTAFAGYCFPQSNVIFGQDAENFDTATLNKILSEISFRDYVFKENEKRKNLSTIKERKVMPRTVTYVTKKEFSLEIKKLRSEIKKMAKGMKSEKKEEKEEMKMRNKKKAKKK